MQGQERGGTAESNREEGFDGNSSNDDDISSGDSDRDRDSGETMHICAVALCNLAVEETGRQKLMTPGVLKGWLVG